MNRFFKQFSLPILVASALSFASAARAEVKTAAAKKVRIPHGHQAEMGRAVLMVGDDHFEVTRDAKKPSLLRIYASDKFRDPVSVEAFDLELTLVSQAGRQKLEAVTSKTTPSEVQVELPKGAPSEAKLELKALRKNPPRGYVTTSNPQLIELTKIAAMNTTHKMNH